MTEAVLAPPVPGSLTQNLAEIGREIVEQPRRAHFPRRLGGRVLAACIALGGLAAADVELAFLPGHQQAEMAYIIADSDAHLLFGPKISITDHSSVEQQYTVFREKFGASNGLFMSSDKIFSWRFEAATWPTATALDAEDILAQYPGKLGSTNRAVLNGSLHAVNVYYWGTQPNGKQCYDPGPVAFNDFAGHGGDCFVDDTLWMGLLNVRTSATKAQIVLNVAESQWNKPRGGVNWLLQQSEDGVTSANNTQNACSSGPAALLGGELALKTHDKPDLDFAKRDLKWLKATLYDPMSGLYFDHISANGDIDRSIYSYTQGVIAAAMATTGDINGAVELIEDSLAYFNEHHIYGIPQFDEKFFKYSLWVAGLVNDPNFTAQIRSAEQMAMKVEPNNPSDLIDAAGELGLEALKELPRKSYTNLVPYKPIISSSKLTANSLTAKSTVAISNNQ